MRGFPLVKAVRAVGWCPWFIPLGSWHWWRWWTAGTSTTNGGGLCLRPDPRVRKTNHDPAAPRLPLLGDRRACTTTGSRRNERRISVGTDSSDESARLRLGAERTAPKLVGEPGIQASAKCRPYHLEKCQLNLERTALSGAVFDCRAVYFAVTLHNDGYQAKTRVRVFLCYREISVLPVVARRVGGQRRAFLGCWQ